MTGLRISDEGLAKAIKVTTSQAELGRRLGVQRSVVNEWVRKGVVPPGRVVAIEKATGVDRELLRPDLYKRSHAA